jgi:hypothetical protein
VRHGFHNLKLKGRDAAAADLVAAEIFPALFQETVERCGCLSLQIFHLDEIGLFWKQILSRTSVSVQENMAPEFKLSKDHCMLLIVGNTSGGYKARLLEVCHSGNSQALKGYSKVLLSVVCQSNKKAWITASIFESYFHSQLLC